MSKINVKDIKTMVADTTVIKIWNQLSSRNLVLKNETYELYDIYKMCAVKIYQNDINLLSKYIDLLVHAHNYLLKMYISEYIGPLKRDWYFVIHNLMLLICIFSDDVQILDYYYQKFSSDININHCDRDDPTTVNFLMHVLKRKYKPLYLVQYLIEKCNIDITASDEYCDNYLDYVLDHYNYNNDSDFLVAKYLIGRLPNLTIDDWTLVNVCSKPNIDLRLIKFLVKEFKLNCKDEYDNTCLNNLLCRCFYGPYCCLDHNSYYTDYHIDHIKNMEDIENMCEVFAYIIELTDIPTLIDSFDDNMIMNIYMFIKLANSIIKNYEKFNAMINKYLTICNHDKDSKDVLLTYMKSIDPCALDYQNCEVIDVRQLKNTLNLNYVNFKKCVDEFEYNDKRIIQILKKRLESSDICSKLSSSKQRVNHIADYTDSTQTKIELLFVHNSIPYYGNKICIYDSILIFKDIEFNHLDGDIVLEGDMPIYLVNAYLDAITTGQKFNLNLVKPVDIFKFLKFIDQYPSDVLSIDRLGELQLSKYIDLNNIKFTDYIKNICDRYQFRYIYLSMHNKQMDYSR